MICFGFIYQEFVNIFYSLFESLENGAFSVSAQTQINNMLGQMGLIGVLLSPIGLLFYLLVGILWALIYFQTLGRGIEMLVLRLRYAFCLYWTFKFRWWCF